MKDQQINEAIEYYKRCLNIEKDIHRATGKNIINAGQAFLKGLKGEHNELKVVSI